MEYILWILMLIFELAAIADAFRSRLPVERKILWSLLIFFLPLVGMIVYFLLGREDRAAAQ